MPRRDRARSDRPAARARTRRIQIHADQSNPASSSEDTAVARTPRRTWPISKAPAVKSHRQAFRRQGRGDRDAPALSLGRVSQTSALQALSSPMPSWAECLGVAIPLPARSVTG